MPVDPEPDPTGNLRLEQDDGGYTVRVEQDRSLPGPWHTSHFATCPQARRHRRA
jgi:hypothetical protein